jgi:hypothetical protein
VLLPDPPPGALPGGWPASPRGAADPACAAWLAGLLPELTRVRVRVSAGVGDAVTQPVSQPVPAGAALGPLDLVLDHPEVVRTRIELALPAGSVLVPGRDPAWSSDLVGLDEVLTVAADLREVLAARALRSTDLLSPAVGSPTTDERDAADLRARLVTARTGLSTAAAAVTAAAAGLATAPPAAGGSDAAAAALVLAASYGVLLQLRPAPGPGDIATALSSASAELQRRLAVTEPADGAAVDDLVGALRSALGSAQPAVPLLLLDDATAGVAGPGLEAGDGYLAAEPELASDWLADVAGVRAGAGRLVAAVQGCDALSASAGVVDRWRVLDPGRAGSPGSTWTGALDAAGLAERAPAATVVLQAGPGVDLSRGRNVSGLLVDEWVEVVPVATASTSVAYQADAPVARAPQVILLGLAPDTAAGWDTDTVVDLVLEALDLARIRTVDAETAAWLGRMLPAVLLPDGDATDVIAAPPRPLLEVDASLLDAARAITKALG